MQKRIRYIKNSLVRRGRKLGLLQNFLRGPLVLPADVHDWIYINFELIIIYQGKKSSLSTQRSNPFSQIYYILFIFNNSTMFYIFRILQVSIDIN